MVVVALAGGSGGVGREIMDALVARNKHEIIILSRKAQGSEQLPSNVRWVQVDYAKKDDLVSALKDVHTVLSFIVVQQDKGNASQRLLIDSCVEAGVKRFAPSEWAGSSPSCLTWYAGKHAIYQYLTELNKEREILEFCCFRPGMLMNYLAYPKKTTKHVEIWGIQIDMEGMRAIVLQDSPNPGTLAMTTVEDVAQVTAHAVDYEGKWPRIGGIRGEEMAMADILQLGEKIRGSPFTVEKIAARQARAGRLTASWYPQIDHSMVPEEMRASVAKTFTAKNVYAIYEGTWKVSDEWNQLLPDYKFTKLEDFLRSHWVAA